MRRPNRFHLSTFVFLPFRSVWILASARTVDTVFHLSSPSLPPALVVILALPPFPSLPSLAYARTVTYVRTPSTMVIHHHPVHQSNNTTVFLPPPPTRYSLVLYVLPFSEQGMEKQQLLNFHVVYDSSRKYF
jgi:hypothetical protein